MVDSYTVEAMLTMSYIFRNSGGQNYRSSKTITFLNKIF